MNHFNKGFGERLENGRDALDCLPSSSSEEEDPIKKDIISWTCQSCKNRIQISKYDNYCPGCKKRIDGKI